MSMTNFQEIDKASQRRTFFRALFDGAQDELYFELRCIHPGDLPPRTFWSKIGDKRNLASAFKRAESLNGEGYGVYFAPCLRSNKSGKADAAALLPAFWLDIDCDGDAAKRDDAFNRLYAFELPPSAILDSGGGLHAYWLLNEPAQLADDVARHRVAAILRGLCEALGGDPQYVKSPASVMRLPGSVNTKPERNGATVTVLELDPDRRYPLEQFAWLETPSLLKTMNSPVTSNGRHPLPPRTEAYLANGAIEGRRNHELFAAACQMRDSEYSQSEAERELIARHLADGGSEGEAIASIRSAYSRPPRNPITKQERQDAIQHVGELVARYQTKQQSERPTTAQIVEVVEACAELNAVEWAEERKRLKALCGDGLKISDIDRLYREKKRQIERKSKQEYTDAEIYLLLNGCIVYRTENYRGIQEKTVADWSATVLHQTCQVDDNGKEIHHTALELHRRGAIKKLDIPGDVFVDDVALRRFIGATAGAQYVVRAGMSKHLVPAIVQLSGEFPTHQFYNFMGWTHRDGKWVYISPHDCIGANGRLAEPPAVELDHRLRDYGLQAADWSESLNAFDAVIKVLPPHLAPCLTAFALLPLLQRFFPAVATRPAVHLAGTSGSGKSEIASLLSSFYGDFSRDTPPAQWGDTVNTVETLGYALADGLFWVDDYKSIYADEKTFTRFLQSYSRGMGRGRLTREAKIRQEKPCRGLLLSTGETTIEGEMSVVARMLVLEVPPWEQRDPDGQALARAEGLRDGLSGFTTHFAEWVARRLESGALKEDIASHFSSGVKHYKAKLATEIGRQSNNDRVVKNWAVLETVYQLIMEFLHEKQAENHLLPWQDVIVDTVQTLREERASEVFLDILGQLIAGGQAVIDEDMKQPRDYPTGTTVVGYKEDGFIYLLPEIAHREVSRVQPLRFTSTAIGMQLKEDGLLVPGPNNLTIQKRVRGGRARFWQLKCESLS